MVKKSRRHFSPEQKAAIVRRHLVDKVPVSDLCDEHKIQPSMLYTWQKAVVDGAARAFEAPAERARGSSRETELSKRIEQLEAKLAKKDAIIAEISEEYVTLKKELGEP
jgi:transposase-like protein